MSVTLVTRDQWKAREPSHPLAAMPSGVKGVKIHYTGGRVDPKIEEDHAKCIKAVKGIQNGHMDGHGWNDIGYSFVVCPHRKTFIGRGLHKLPAANGPGLNSGHYAILGLVGNSGYVKPNDAMLLGILDTIEYIRREGPAGHEIKGHKDGYATDCPGKYLYAWVRAGAPRPEELTWTEKAVMELPVLKLESEGFDVLTLRGLLFERYVAEKYPLASNASLDDYAEVVEWIRDPHFDGDLESKVTEYQKWRFPDDKAQWDGVVGKNTWSALLRVEDN